MPPFTLTTASYDALGWSTLSVPFHFQPHPSPHLKLRDSCSFLQLGGCYPADFLLKGYQSTLRAAQAQLVVSACLF